MGRYRLSATSSLLLCKAKISHLSKSQFLKMVIDTGSSQTLIRSGALADIGINTVTPNRWVVMTGVTGVSRVPVVSVPTFECFGFQLHYLDVTAHALPEQTGLDGLLGLDVLRKARIKIDLRNNMIEMPD